MFDSKKLQTFIRNNEILLRMPEKHYNHQEAKHLVITLAREVLNLQLKLEAYEEIRLARKSKLEPSEATWTKWRTAQKHLEESVFGWQETPAADTEEAAPFRVSQEYEAHNAELLKDFSVKDIYTVDLEAKCTPSIQP